MKKKWIIGLMGLMGLVCLTGCGKEHQCKCEKTDVDAGYDENLVFVLDGSIGCENITEMAFEEHVTVDGATSLRRVEVHKVKCRSYGD